MDWSSTRTSPGNVHQWHNAPYQDTVSPFLRSLLLPLAVAFTHPGKPFHEHAPSKALRRSNAVHRRRTGRAPRESSAHGAREPDFKESYLRVSRQVLTAMLQIFDERDPEYVYGRFRLFIGSDLISYELRRNDLQSAASLQEDNQLTPDKADQVSQGIELICVEATLYHHVGTRDKIHHNDLHYLLMQLEARELRPIPIYRALARFTQPKYDPLHYHRPISSLSQSS